jgi:hypothetical protein
MGLKLEFRTFSASNNVVPLSQPSPVGAKALLKKNELCFHVNPWFIQLRHSVHTIRQLSRGK